MLTPYIAAAMRRAHYEILDDQPDAPFYGEIFELPGVWANAATLEECREELQSALEDWILTGIWLGHTIPPIDGIDINRPALPLQPVVEVA
jgi:predicted RNase H-like HicB family nuclease